MKYTTADDSGSTPHFDWEIYLIIKNRENKISPNYTHQFSFVLRNFARLQNKLYVTTKYFFLSKQSDIKYKYTSRTINYIKEQYFVFKLKDVVSYYFRNYQ